MSECTHDSKLHRARGLWGLVTIGIIGLYLYGVQGYNEFNSFLNDDAFISFRYADQWAKHGEIVYNLGERVEGYTNFLWVALMAWVIYWGGDVTQWSLYLGMFFGGATLIWLRYCIPRFLSSTHLCSSAHHSTFHTSLCTWLCLFLLASSPAYTCWSSGGLEVTLFTFLLSVSVLGACYIYSIALKSSWVYMMVGVLFALTSMTRPEGLLFIGVMGIFRVAHLATNRSKPYTYDYALVCGFFLLYLPYFYWRYHYYGYYFPNTYYVKTGAALLWQPGLRYIFDFIVKHPWSILALGMMGKAVYQTRSSQSQHHDMIVEKTAKPTQQGFNIHLYIMSVVGLFILHVIKIGGDFMALHRFLVPITPLLACYASVCFLSIIQHISRIQFISRFRLLCTTTFVITVMILCILSTQYHQQQALKVGSQAGVDSIGWLKQFSKQCAAIGRWINHNTSPDTRLATTAAGAIAFYSDRYTLDLLGLNDEWIAHHVKPRSNRPGHGKSAPFNYPLKKKVDYLIYHPTIQVNKPRAHPKFKQALSPWKYQWRTYHIPDMQPHWWGVWVKIKQ